MPSDLITVIPSKGRPDLLSSKVLSWLVFSKYPYKVFIEEQEYDDYRRVLSPENIEVIPKSNQGLGYVKYYMSLWLSASDYEFAFKLDGDVRLRRRGALQAPDAIALDFDRAIVHSLDAFHKYPDVVAVGFPYRWELWDVRRWVGMNSRLQTCFIARTDYFVGDPRISTFEDFHNYLHIRSQNKMTLRYGLIGIDTDVGKGAGGLQSFDRHKMALTEVEVLREIYPALEVRKVEGKTWGIEPVLKGDFFGVKKI